MNAKAPILLVEDSEVDVMTVRRSLRDLKSASELSHVSDDEEALKFLRDSANPPLGSSCSSSTCRA
jgi:CheY-like chemotaxis protein